MELVVIFVWISMQLQRMLCYSYTYSVAFITQFLKSYIRYLYSLRVSHRATPPPMKNFGCAPALRCVHTHSITFHSFFTQVPGFPHVFAQRTRTLQPHAPVGRTRANSLPMHRTALWKHDFQKTMHLVFPTWITPLSLQTPQLHEKADLNLTGLKLRHLT
jgi:hypothetical protein